MQQSDNNTAHLSHDLITVESRGGFGMELSPSQILIPQQEQELDDFTKIELNIPGHSDATNSKLIRFVVLSDTHRCQNMYNYWYDDKTVNRRVSLEFERKNSNNDNLIKLPKGDYLLHCGDFSNYCLPNELMEFNTFLGKIKHRYKQIIVIPGNHEFCADLISLFLTNATVLMNEFIELEDGKISLFGSRFKSFWKNWKMTGYDYDAQTDWKPLVDPVENGEKKVDILMTHQPPDFKKTISQRFFRRGSKSLKEAVYKVNPKVHIFGHNHDVYGVKYSSDFELETPIETTFISACSVDAYENVRKAVIFDYPIKD